MANSYTAIYRRITFLCFDTKCSYFIIMKLQLTRTIEIYIHPEPLEDDLEAFGLQTCVCFFLFRIANKGYQNSVSDIAANIWI